MKISLTSGPRFATRDPRLTRDVACVLECGGKQSATPLSKGMRLWKTNLPADEQPRSKAVSQPPHSKTFRSFATVHGEGELLSNSKLKIQNSKLIPHSAFRAPHSALCRAFTMMEIAISLAVIGVALVAIIGVLPIGMNVQQDNRQQTIVGQDSSVLMEAIRNGSLGYDDLTNYVYAITNTWTEFDPATGETLNQGSNWFTYSSYFVAPDYYYQQTLGAPLTNGANIIGNLSTPEFTDGNGNPTANIYTADYYSNHVVAYVYSISGPAIYKPPQDNTIMQQDSFAYRIYCVNDPVGVNTNDFFANTVTPYEQDMINNLHELRLTFLWPQLPNGNLGSGRQTFRTLVAGQLAHQPPFNPANTFISWNTNFYYYQSQSFTTNTP